MPPTLKSFTAEVLRECQERDERRRALNREADQLEKENKVILADLHAAFLAEGKTSIKRGELLALLEEYRERVKWQEEYLRECGGEKAAALQAAAAMKTKVTIRPAV